VSWQTFRRNSIGQIDLPRIVMINARLLAFAVAAIPNAGRLAGRRDDRSSLAVEPVPMAR
jgi:hypothetical protein